MHFFVIFILYKFSYILMFTLFWAKVDDGAGGSSIGMSSLKFSSYANFFLGILNSVIIYKKI